MGLKNDGILCDGIHKIVEPASLFRNYVLDNGGYRWIKEQKKGVYLPADDLLGPGVRVSIRKIEPECMNRMMEKALQDCKEGLTEDVYERFTEPLEYDEIGIRIDPACFLVFALIWNGRCRNALETLMPGETVYYEYYGKSKYSGPAFESHFRAEDIWMARRLLGMLEKIRAQGEPGEEGAILMRIVYAGYRYLKRSIRNLHSLSGADIRGMLWKDVEKCSGMEKMSRIVLAVLIAEDLGISLEWDYDWLVMAMLLEEYEEEFIDWDDEENGSCGRNTETEDDGREADNGRENSGEDGGDEAEAERKRRTEAKLQHFLAEFCRKFGTDCCLSELVLHHTEEQWEKTLPEVLRMFHISERIFYGHGLTQEEVQKLLHMEEEWSEESFWGMLAAAQLCKYISELTEKYLECSSENSRYLNHISDREKEALLLAGQQQKQEIGRLQAEKLAMNKSLYTMEQQIAALQKQLQEIRCREQAQKQELAELRSFAFGLSQKYEIETDAVHQQERFCEWKARKVIVVGGHANWQGKLREKFPNWQFVGANQKSVSPDCLKGKKFIVCNTELLTHACYYKILAARNRDQKILYVHSNNLEKCMQEMERQLE